MAPRKPSPQPAPPAGGPPEFLRFSADLTTPVRAFLALVPRAAEGFLLESVAGGERQARYSFLGLDPLEVLEAGPRGAALRREGVRISLPGPPLAALDRWLASFPAFGREGLPFLAQAVGAVDFSAFALAEPSLAPAFRGSRSNAVLLGRFGTGLVLDHALQEGLLYGFPRPGERREDLRRRLRRLRDRLSGPVAAPRSGAGWKPSLRPRKEHFLKNVEAAKEAIARGDAYQIVLSEPFGGHYDGDPFDLYRRLRRLNPSPYHFFLSLGGRCLLGASPEMLVRAEPEEVLTVPIAGTRPRGKTAEEDRRLEAALRADPKERAEHAMLVDLSRNDLGRVCLPGTVEVPVREAVERYSHVLHLVSEVRGIPDGAEPLLRAFWSTFPAGTVSGAPKIRAAEILRRLEGADRRSYGGAVLLVDPPRRLEACIAIRCLETEGGRVHFRSGAGIVADSEREAEWEEIHHKAGAVLAALENRETSRTTGAARAAGGLSP